MNSRERVLAALNHEQPDRVPIDLGGWVSTIHHIAYRRLVEHLGVPDAKGEVRDWIQQTVIPDESVLQRLGVDTRYIRPGNPVGKDWELKRDEDEDHYYITDGWGVKRAMPKKGGLYYDIVFSECPLKDATVKDLEEYPWPNPRDPGFIAGLEEQAQDLYENSDYAIVADFNFESWYESAWYMRGFAQFYMDMIRNPEFVDALLEKLSNLHMEFLDHVLEVTGKYVHVIMQGDDLAAQNGPLMSLEAYRRFIKPRQKKVFDLIKQKTEAKLFYHCCGSVYRFIPDLLEIGIDILNPIQVSAKDMNTKRLKKEYGDKLVFWGAIDTQHVLPFGTPQDVENEVKRRIEDLGHGGGYILASVHNIQADVPPENIVAMFDTAQNYKI